MAKPAREITKYDDVIDSRDVIQRTEELTDRNADGALDPSEVDELGDLLDLAKQCEGYVDDWVHGAQLIRATHFKSYAMDLAEDCGMLEKGAAWPYTCIDWNQAADELKMDYTSVQFAGIEYFVR